MTKLRNLILFPLFLFLTINSFAQNFKKDTIVKVYRNDLVKKYYPKDWGLQIGLGATGSFYDNKTKKYINNHIGIDFELVFFVKNLHLGFSFKPATIIPADTLFFKSEKLFNEAKLNVIKTDITIGYNINFAKNISIEPYLGYLSTTFLVINEEDIGKDFELTKARGITSGFKINKYVKLKYPGEYFVIFLDNNFNYSNFSNMHNDLGNVFYSIEIGFAYKGWFSKRIRE